MENLDTLKDIILSGGQITANQAYELADITAREQEHLRDLATEITDRMSTRTFDSCSIVNARSGKCPEDCKWCAQSAHYKTTADVYPLISHEQCIQAADMNREHRIKRFSMVTSGRKLSAADIKQSCEYLSDLRDRGGLQLCASMGLLDRESLQALKDSGITRYHCNLEAGPSHFRTLCTTHTTEDKIRTILMAREVGLEVCSGGIIGMGETMRQRIELALELRRISPVSIPINILCPIPGTPLEHCEPLTDDDILNTIAIFRLIHPKAVLRLAGGRMYLSRDGQLKALKMAINGAIMGDMLTTSGATLAQDRELLKEAGYHL